LLSSVARFAIEFTRNHEQALQMGLSLTQWIAIGTALAGVALLVRSSAPAKVNRPVTA
jgi:prolipoprotein diacylglyceryltransferase